MNWILNGERMKIISAGLVAFLVVTTGCSKDDTSKDTPGPVLVVDEPKPVAKVPTNPWYDAWKDCSPGSSMKMKVDRGFLFRKIGQRCA